MVPDGQSPDLINCPVTLPLSQARAATVRRMSQATGPDGRRLHTVAEIAQTAGIHRTTVYDYLNREG